MPAKEYDYLKDTILVTYPDGPETYGATQAAPSSGVDASDATAVADDIRLGKTAYVASGKVTGTIEDYDGSTEPASGKSLFAQMADGSITEVSAGDLEGATKISEFVFYKCSSLKSITIGNSVTSIGNSAFRDCSSLTSIKIPDSVMSIGGSAFYGCSGLTSITIGNSVTSIDNSVFYGCSSLVTITIPDSVTSIGNSAFYGCSSLASITIPDSVTKIDVSAFNGCKALTSITIGNSVTSIDNSVFYGCSGLTSITIPSGVTKIDVSAFKNCSSLASITIGNGVTSIGGSAFSYCGTSAESGTTYTFLSTTPSAIKSNTFQNAKINKIIVPAGTADAYKAATNWSALANYIEEATA